MQLQTALATSYALKRELRRGGMATVFLARDLRHDRLVALKVLHADLARRLGPERFRREIRLAAWLQHPHRQVLPRPCVRTILVPAVLKRPRPKLPERPTSHTPSQ